MVFRHDCSSCCHQRFDATHKGKATWGTATYYRFQLFKRLPPSIQDKTRRGIKRKLYEGEADNADMTIVDTGRKELQRVLKDYQPDDIFNLDETGLFYRLGPNYTLATSKVSGTKKSKGKNYCSPDDKCHRHNKD